MRTHPQIPTWRRNLSRRLPKPAQGRGRVQQACHRALVVHGTASTSDVIAWAYAQRLLIWGDPRGTTSIELPGAPLWRLARSRRGFGNLLEALIFGQDASLFAGRQSELFLSAPGGKMVVATANLPQHLLTTHGGAVASTATETQTQSYLNTSGGRAIEILLGDGAGHFLESNQLAPASYQTVNRNPGKFRVSRRSRTTAHLIPAASPSRMLPSQPRASRHPRALAFDLHDAGRSMSTSMALLRTRPP